MSTKLYDETNPISIENYAQKLIGKTFNDVLNDYTKYESELLISEEKEEYAENHENKKKRWIR